MATRVPLFKILPYAYPEQNSWYGPGQPQRGPMATFGEKIRDLRKKAKLTLEQLGEMTDSSKSYIWEIENKNPPRPSADKIDRIARALGVTADYLMDETADLVTAEDEAFFRKYRELSPEAKEKLRKITDVL
ncbi:helix-turn-helix domain-containing protein [Bosea sp. TAF32]|uniref:helix-turn-helix domain-containing protein n=1 Tax=Bosea sp. TAF32 TaxID=3237482 RepID=UPI003F9292E0